MPLYHYTDAHAVHSILKTKKIRLTDIRFLNDTAELLEGLSILEDTLINEIDSDLKYAGEAAKMIHRSLINVETSNNDLNPLYVFSLTSESDQLSQWKAYGPYALEFDEELLREHVEILAPCIYDFNEKIKRSMSEVKKSVNVISEEMEKQGGSIGPNGYDSMIYLMHDAAAFKHAGFIEENESRIIVPQDEKYEIQYLPRNSMLIPYIEIEIPLDCIKSIKLGPMKDQELAFISMSDFASQIEREWQNETSNIEYWLKVKKSPIPYRA